jgi:hypothetical protein
MVIAIRGMAAHMDLKFIKNQRRLLSVTSEAVVSFLNSIGQTIVDLYQRMGNSLPQSISGRANIILVPITSGTGKLKALLGNNLLGYFYRPHAEFTTRTDFYNVLHSASFRLDTLIISQFIIAS